MVYTKNKKQINKKIYNRGTLKKKNYWWWKNHYR